MNSKVVEKCDGKFFLKKKSLSSYMSFPNDDSVTC